MALGAPTHLEESDIPSAGVRTEWLLVRPELRNVVASMSYVEAQGAARVFLPDVLARILLVRDASAPRFHGFLVGPRIRTMRKKAARQEAINLRLSPGAIPALMSIPASAAAHTIVSLESLWGDSVRPWLDRLAQEPSRAQRQAIVEQELLTRMHGSPPATGSARLLASLAMEDGARVATVAERLGMSERHLRRVFHEAVGLPPKAYARVARLRRAVGLARYDATATWTRVAVDAGYFDQAHMVAEFRALTGCSPRALRRELAGEWGP